MYGADRMLLRVVQTLRDEADISVLLPNDVSSSTNPLTAHLATSDARAEIVELPIIRRAYMNAAGLLTLAQKAARLRKRLRRERPDALWCATSATLIAAPVARLAGIKCVVLHNQEIWGRRERIVLGLLGLFATRIVTISDASLRSLPRYLQSRTQVIENATEAPETLAPPPNTPQATFLVASRWNAWKGHRTLFAAWAAADQPGTLVVAGGRPPVGESVDVEALAREFAIAESVEIIGERPDLSKLMRSANFVIVPSDDPEPFGLIAIEAFANGRPVIASAGGGLGSIVTHGVDGYLFRNRDSAELAEALKLATVKQSAELSVAARQTFELRYSMAAFSEGLLEFWRDLPIAKPLGIEELEISLGGLD